MDEAEVTTTCVASLGFCGRHSNSDGEAWLLEGVYVDEAPDRQRKSVLVAACSRA